MNPNALFSTMTMTGVPEAYAVLRGGSKYPSLVGTVNFYQHRSGIGIIIEAAFQHLPSASAPAFLGFHIHDNGNCSDNFAHTGMHYNPKNAEHPNHLGDLIPVFNSDGSAYLAFYDSYLSISDIIGRSVILHEKADDFTTQPAGDSGDKIGCGVILPVG